MPGIWGDGQRGGIFGAKIDPRLQAELERRADIRRSYTTALSPMQELKFRDWKQRFAPNDSGEDYDLRGAFKAGFQPDPETGHWPDVYKKPNHPTFSNQSIYARDKPEMAGSWDGDTYVPSPLRRHLDVEAERERQAQAESQAYLESLDRSRPQYVPPARNLDPSQIPPREMPQSFDETLTGTIGDVVYGAPVIGPAALGLGARIGAAGQALQGKQGYSQALEDIQTKQENYRRLNPEISGSAQWAGSGLFAPAFGGSAAGQIIGNAALGGADAAVRGGDPSLAAVAGGGIAGALHLPAIFGGVMARTANRGMLTLATDLKNGGFTPEEIWKKTGWFQGTDDKWRFEIPDQGAHFFHAGKDRIAAGEEVPLSGGSTTGSGGVFAHPQLYEAYPQLRDVKLHNRASEGNLGTSYGGNIGLAPKWRGDMESTLLHELQHEVQDIEGFAKGGQTKQFAMDPASMANAQKHLDDLLAAQSLQHEVRSGGVDLKTAIKLHKELGMTITPYAENMAGVASPEILEKDIASVLKNIELAARGGYAGYSRLAGEVEARNVQARAKYKDPEELRKILPTLTQDVPRGEQIVRGVGTKP